MTEEEQEKLYELLFKDTKNKLEATIEKLRIANAELRDELDKKNSEIEELEKYDYRNIKISEDNKLSSIHFTKEQLDLMNLGIALYIGIPKMFEESEENDT